MGTTLEAFTGTFYVANDIQSGDADLSVAINRTLVRANAAGGGTVRLPRGSYTKTKATAAIQLFSNIVLEGEGRGITTLVFDDTGAGSNGLFLSGTSGAHLSNVTLRGFTVKGMHDTQATSSNHVMQLQYIDDLLIEQVESRYSRIFGICLNSCTNVVVNRCKVYRSRTDGIAAWSCSSVRITDNYVRECGDDAISCHADDTDTAPTRSGLIISGNEIEFCNGIKALGARSTTIRNNVLRRVYAYGVFVGTSSSFEQGNTPESSVIIDGNVINDVIPHPTGATAYTGYIVIGGVKRQAGSLNAAPGWNYTTSGAIISPYGTSGTGYFYGNDVDDTSTTPSPGSWSVYVTNNICKRTLPSVSLYSDWGYGAPFCMGSVVDQAVTEANLTPGIGLRVTESVRNVLIAGNQIKNTTTAINFVPLDTTSPTSLGFAGVTVRDNLLWQFATAGLLWTATTPTSPQDIRVEDNEFDGDPLFSNANRGSNGTWAASGAPTAIDFTKLKMAMVSGNKFRNVCRVLVETTAGDNFNEGNILFCQPVAAAFSTSNRGIGTPGSQGGAYMHHIEDCDPTSSTFKQMFYQPARDRRTNLIRNNTGQGLSAGTPGTKPTNWNGFAAQDSLTTTMVGSGSENGIEYVDVKLAGTASAGNTISLTFESATQIAAAPGDIFTASTFRKLAAGSMTGITRVEDMVQEYATGSSFIATRAPGTATAPTSANLGGQRQSYTMRVQGSTAVVVRSGVNIVYTNGGVIDITLRIGLPQLERGSVATSPIRTTSAAVTKVSASAFDELADLIRNGI